MKCRTSAMYTIPLYCISTLYTHSVIQCRPIRGAGCGSLEGGGGGGASPTRPTSPDSHFVFNRALRLVLGALDSGGAGRVDRIIPFLMRHVL